MKFLKVIVRKTRRNHIRNEEVGETVGSGEFEMFVEKVTVAWICEKNE